MILCVKANCNQLRQSSLFIFDSSSRELFFFLLFLFYFAKINRLFLTFVKTCSHTGKNIIQFPQLFTKFSDFPMMFRIFIFIHLYIFSRKLFYIFHEIILLYFFFTLCTLRAFFPSLVFNRLQETKPRNIFFLLRCVLLCEVTEKEKKWSKKNSTITYIALSSLSSVRTSHEAGEYIASYHIKNMKE